MHSVYFGWIFVVRITKLTPLKPMTFCFSFQVAGLHSHSETENPLVRRQNHHDPRLVPLIRMCKLRVTSEKKKTCLTTTQEWAHCACCKNCTQPEVVIPNAN